MYAKVLDPTLTLDSEPIGGQADFSISFGGNSSAQAKRSIAGGTTTVARGPYSTVFGDNCVTLSSGSDSLAHGYQTVTDAPASHTEGSYTVVMNKKYTEGMFDPSAEPGQPGQPTEPSETPTDTLAMDTRRGEAGHASGFNSYVSGFAGYTDGVSNVADGHISKASGRSNRSWSYLSKTDGKNSVVKPDSTDTTATGEGSWANGDNVQIVGAKYAYSGGTNNYVGSEAHNSFSYGNNLNVIGENQCVVGQYNSTDVNSVFEVGTGTPDHRNTSFKVTKDGKVYCGSDTVATSTEVSRKIGLSENETLSRITRVDARKLDTTGGVLTGTVYLTNGGMRIGTNSIAQGNGIKDGHLYLGTYNEGSESNIFEVGSGADSVNRVNALSVSNNGYVKVTNAPISGTDVVNLRYANSYYYRVTNCTLILENVDLNSCKTPGTYQVNTDTIGGTIKNTPYPYAFKLIVQRFSDYYIQKLIGKNGDEYQRSYNGSEWLSWTKLATISDIDEKLSDVESSNSVQLSHSKILNEDKNNIKVDTWKTTDDNSSISIYNNYTALNGKSGLTASKNQVEIKSTASGEIG